MRNLAIAQMLLDIEVSPQFAGDWSIVLDLRPTSNYAGFKNRIKCDKTSMPAHVYEQMKAFKDDAD